MTITEMMNETWGQYEAERESGNDDLAMKIADAYTVLDIIDTNEIDSYREYAEDTYYGLSGMITKELIRGEETPAVIAYRMLEEALVKVGILEADEEPEDEEEGLDYTNDAQHWDEWVADQKYDMYRDMALMGYER